LSENLSVEVVFVPEADKVRNESDPHFVNFSVSQLAVIDITEHELRCTA
jgi:hypothetical protein